MFLGGDTMEPQVTICCKKDNSKCVCKWTILVILIALFMTTIGIIIGAALSETFLGALAAIIVLAIILFILVVIQIIMLVCCSRRR